MPFTLYYVLKVIKNDFKYTGGYLNTKSFYKKDLTIHGVGYLQLLLKPINPHGTKEELHFLKVEGSHSFFLFLLRFFFLR